MIRHGALARKRHKKLLKRKFIRKVKQRMYVDFGGFVGSQMYRKWRESQCAKS